MSRLNADALRPAMAKMTTDNRPKMIPAKPKAMRKGMSSDLRQIAKRNVASVAADHHTHRAAVEDKDVRQVGPIIQHQVETASTPRTELWLKSLGFFSAGY